jgi:hypothetical protein
MLVVLALLVPSVAFSTPQSTAPLPALNLSHIECTEDGNIDVHFVLVHTPEGTTLGDFGFGVWFGTFPTNTAPATAITGSTTHFHRIYPSGTTFNLSWAGVLLKGGLIGVGLSIDDYNGTYICEPEPEPEQCGRCSNVFVGWVEWVDRDGGCDDDFYNERVEFPFDDRCYTNCQGELIKTAGLSSAPRDNGEGQWITCTSFRYSDINTEAFCFAESECTVVYTTCDETVLNRSWTEEILTPEGAVQVTTFFEYVDSLDPEVVCRVTEEVEIVYESCLNAESTYEVPGEWTEWFTVNGPNKERSRTVEVFDGETDFKCGEYTEYDQECFADDFIWVWQGCGCSIRDRTYELYQFGSPPLVAQRAYCGCDFSCMDEGAWNDSGYVNNCQGEDYTFWDELPKWCGFTSCE